jgi:hypothetical protein
MSWRCVGYAKGRKGRCTIALEVDRARGAWVDPGTSRPGSSLEEEPRCTYHPKETDPPGWEVPAWEPPGVGEGEGEGELSPPPPAPDPGNLEAELELELPVDLFAGMKRAPDTADDPVAVGAGSADHVHDLDSLEAVAGAILGGAELEGDAEGSSSSGQDGGELEGGGAPAWAKRAPTWRRHARSILAGPVQSKLERDGVDPLEPGEVEWGAEALGDWLAWLLQRADPNNPHAALAMFAILTFAPRYLGRAFRGDAAEGGEPEGAAAPRGRKAPAGWAGVDLAG